MCHFIESVPLTQNKFLCCGTSLLWYISAFTFFDEISNLIRWIIVDGGNSVRKCAWPLFLMPLLLYGCGQTNVPPKIQVPSAAGVQSIAIQGPSNTVVTIAGGSTGIKTLISELRNAKEVQYEKEIQLGSKPIATADLHLTNGNDVTVQTAIACQIQNNHGQGKTVCKNLPGYVDYISNNNLPIRLQSQALYDWLLQKSGTDSTNR